MFSPECRVCRGKGSLVVGMKGLECRVKKFGLYSGVVRSCGRFSDMDVTRFKASRNVEAEW